jgi:hypothetical protein
MAEHDKQKTRLRILMILITSMLFGLVITKQQSEAGVDGTGAGLG